MPSMPALNAVAVFFAARAVDEDRRDDTGARALRPGAEHLRPALLGRDDRNR